MITAHCDACGREIEPETPAACRLTLGKSEITFHLCEPDQDALRAHVEAFLAAHPWRVVR